MSPPHQFHPAARILHWIMAVAIVAMLFIGVGMASTVSGARTSLLPVHRSLGVVLLALTAVRLGVRLARRAPPLPADMPAWQRRAAGASQVVLYVLMFAIPIVGWAMLSAGGYPVTLLGGVSLPSIAPQSPALHAALRRAHTYLALLLFGVFLQHLAAALFHLLIRNDDVFASMAPRWRPRLSRRVHAGDGRPPSDVGERGAKLG
ncbi:cytochrome b [Sorangium sp. So ce327]|uniref:cytochrome b n=1 Tax=Sorangium sp. So ce327 TaxID=3133301 RepID=UPI003F632F22